MRATQIGIVVALTAIGAACGLDLAGTGGADAADAGSGPTGPGTKDSAVAADSPTPPSDASASDADGEAPNPGYAGRVQTGLIAFYDMEEGTGNNLNDTVSKFNLQIDHTDTGHLVWHPHYFTFPDDNRAASGGGVNFDEMTTACQASHEYTAEAWVSLTGTTQGGQTFGRIATMAPADSDLDFAIGTSSGKAFWAASAQNENVTGGTLVPGKLTHVATTRATDGTLTLYIDSQVASSSASSTDPSNWTSHQVAIGNTANETRGVHGDIHLVALYTRALSSAEVYQNFIAGADP